MMGLGGREGGEVGGQSKQILKNELGGGERGEGGGLYNRK